jgi:hypothetical protein
LCKAGAEPAGFIARAIYSYTFHQQVAVVGSHSSSGVHAERATVNQHPPAHHEGWMINGEKAVFCWVPGPWLTMVVSSVAFLITYLLTTHKQVQVFSR